MYFYFVKTNLSRIKKQAKNELEYKRENLGTGINCFS